jgi:hypothetical protein
MFKILALAVVWSVNPLSPTGLCDLTGHQTPAIRARTDRRAKVDSSCYHRHSLVRKVPLLRSYGEQVWDDDHRREIQVPPLAPACTL